MAIFTGKIIEAYFANSENAAIFGGRPVTYKYLDMWMTIKQVFTKLK